jgi:hypothetical protein
MLRAHHLNPVPLLLACRNKMVLSCASQHRVLLHEPSLERYFNPGPRTMHRIGASCPLRFSRNHTGYAFAWLILGAVR